MSGIRTGYADIYLDQAQAYVRKLVKARRLPYQCPACDARTNHTGAHWTPDGGSMCGSKPVWASDLPEVKS